MSPLRYVFLLIMCLLMGGCGASNSPTVESGQAVEILYGYPAMALLNTAVTAVINPSTGGFSSVSVAPSTFGCNGGMATVNGRFLYLSADVEIIGLSIDPTNGVLTTLAGSPFALASGRSVQGLAVTPNSNFLYAADAAGGIDAFQVNSSTGALSTIAGSPSGAGANYAVTVDPSGRFVYAVDYADSEVLAFAIGSTGSLTAIPGSPFALPGATTANPVGIVSTGSFVYVALDSANEIAGFSINAQTGALAAVPGSPFSTGKYPVSFALSGNFLYVANFEDGDISGYSINPLSGVLTPLSGSPFFPDKAIAVIAADPSGKYLYASQTVGIMGCNIDPATGALSQGVAGVSNDGALWLTIVQPSTVSAQQN